VWVTKYRKGILTGEVGNRLREVVREICRTNDIEILQGSIGKDHVHVLLSCPPNLSPSKIMQYIKGKSDRKLLMEFRHLQKMYWGRHFWARGYFVASSGNVTDEVIMEYIRAQEDIEPGDGGENFHAYLRTYRLQPIVVQFRTKVVECNCPITRTMQPSRGGQFQGQSPN
jgi:putative transposase